MTKEKPFQIHIEEGTKERLREASKANFQSMAGFIRQATVERMDKLDKAKDGKA
jgi:hypothetical protein